MQQYGRDPDTHLRTDRGDGNAYNSIGSVQGDLVGDHTHSVTTFPQSGTATNCVTALTATVQDPGQTLFENRPINRSAGMVVKY